MPDLTAAVRKMLDHAENCRETFDDCRVCSNTRLIAKICRLALAVLEPEWSKEPPTEPGWYWIARRWSPLSVCEVEIREGDQWCRYVGAEATAWWPLSITTSDDAVMFCGPLPSPPLRAENAELRGSNG